MRVLHALKRFRGDSSARIWTLGDRASRLHGRAPRPPPTATAPRAPSPSRRTRGHDRRKTRPATWPRKSCSTLLDARSTRGVRPLARSYSGSPTRRRREYRCPTRDDPLPRGARARDRPNRRAGPEPPRPNTEGTLASRDQAGMRRRLAGHHGDRPSGLPTTDRRLLRRLVRSATSSANSIGYRPPPGCSSSSVERL